MSRVGRRTLAGAALTAGMTLGLTGTATAPAMVRPCQPIARADNVHTSSGDASSHGWWLQGTCNSAAAQVGIALWMKWTSDGQWHQMASKIGTVAPGGGSGNRVTARATCKDGSTRTWHSTASVTLTGGGDTETSPNVSIPCRA